MKIFSRDTLDLRITGSSLLVRGVLYFLLSIPILLLTAEVVGRSSLGALLPAPSVQADNFLLDAKIYQLEGLLRRDGSLDCLFLGSSVSNSDIDPAVIEQVFLEQTGDVIHCYNLGIPALTLKNATAIAEAAINRFHPRVLIYAMLPRDINDITANVNYIEKTDWVTYNRGSPSVNGWLVNHSHAWRYFITWRYWLTPKNRIKAAEDTRGLTGSGFQPAQGFRDPYIPNNTMNPARLHGAWTDSSRAWTLENFLTLRGKGVKIVLLEGPAYHEPDGSDSETWRTYQEEYLPTLVDILQANNIPFWRTQEISIQIPRQHWYDWLHLNDLGAETFSRWLGGLMAENAGLFK